MTLKKIQIIILACFLVVGTSLVSCKTPEGCAAADSYKSAASLESGKAKKGDSNLFSKKQRKKMKKRGQ